MNDNNPNFMPTPAPMDELNQRPRHTRRTNRGEGLKSAFSTVAVLLAAPLIAVFLTMFVFQSYQVDGESMQTTLFHNDRLLVWKVPRTWSKITGHGYVPKRGDVIVFTEPALSRYGQDPGKQLIKRVIGLPGERVVVSNNELTIYNDEHPQGFKPDKDLPYGNVIHDTPIEGDWKVGKDQIFVAGDNRNNSLDSRTFGPINISNIVGKLVIRVLPLEDIKRF